MSALGGNSARRAADRAPARVGDRVFLAHGFLIWTVEAIRPAGKFDLLYLVAMTRAGRATRRQVYQGLTWPAKDVAPDPEPAASFPVTLGHPGNNGASKKDCHCEGCLARRASTRAAMRRRRAGLGLPEGDPRHGMNGYHNYGCRCPVCTVAAVEYNKQRRQNDIDKAVRIALKAAEEARK